MTLSKITALPQQWDTEPDNVNTVSTAAEIKQKLMDNPEHIVAFLDSLIDIFNSTTAGSSGTENIAARAITGVTGATAYAQILDIKTQLDAAILGAIPDGSLVTAKLADDAVTDPKIGDRTIDDSVAATGDTAELGVLLNNLANMLKSISGETSWDTAPGTTLKAHINDYAYQVAGGTATAITLTIEGSLVDGYPMTFIASADNSGAATTINTKPLYKPNTTDAPTLVSGKAYTVWYDQTGDNFFIKASAEGDATAADVLAGKTFSNDNDTGLIGTATIASLGGKRYATGSGSKPYTSGDGSNNIVVTGLAFTPTKVIVSARFYNTGISKYVTNNIIISSPELYVSYDGGCREIHSTAQASASNEKINFSSVDIKDYYDAYGGSFPTSSYIQANGFKAGISSTETIDYKWWAFE